MTDQGLVQAVRSITHGSYVALAASIGASSLVVESSLDFDETGGTLLLNGVLYPYTAVNYDTDTITLAGTLSGATVLTDRVDVSPASTEKQALVVTAGSEDAVTVRVPHTLVPLLPEGVRTDAEMESVQFEWVNGQFILTDVVGRTPIVDGSYIDETTLPPAPSDGLPPSSVPTLTATGTIGAILLRWVPIANHDTVTYNLYGSTTLGFTAGPGNLLHSGTESSFTHRPSPLDYAATYYYRLETEDVDGVGPLSAEVSAQLVQATDDDIAAAYAYLGRVFVDQLEGGTLAADILLSSTITTRGGGTGAGLDINDTLTRYDSTGMPTAILGDTNTFKGDLEATSATFTGAAAFRGTTEVAKGAEVILREGTTAPAAPPSAIVGWPDPVVSNDIVGAYGLQWISGTEFACVSDTASGPVVRFTGATTDLPLDTPASNYHPWGGFAKIGSNWFSLSWQKVSGVYTWWIDKFDSSGNWLLADDYTPLDGAFGSGGSVSQTLGVAALGTDGTSLFVAEFDDANNRFRIQTRSASTLAVTTTFNTAANAGFTGPVVGVKKGSFDFGSSQYMILSANGTHTWYFDATTGVYNGSAFYNPQPGSMSGFDWDGTRFWSTRAKYISTNAWVYKHTTYTWSGTDPKTHYVTSTWRDTNATGGTHETNMGPAGSFPMKKRAAVTLTSPAIPAGGGTDDPNAASFYLGIVDTVRTNLWRQTPPADGVNTVTVGDAVTFAGSNPPSSNNFPGAVPAVIRNSASTLLVSGDGSIDATAISVDGVPVNAGPTTVNIFGTSSTWSHPDGLKAVRVRVVGSGASGGGSPVTGAGQVSCGAGGGAGGYAEAWILAASLGSTVTVTIGSAGTGNLGATGSNGNACSFGAFVAADGGDAGNILVASSVTNSSMASSAGGAGTAGDILARGGPGGPALRAATIGVALGGNGGDSVFGGGGAYRGANLGGGGGTAYGAGGAGTTNGPSQATARIGGDGATGVVIVENFF